MSEERKDVLKMLADKVISVEEAERLLKALDDGDQKRRESESRSFHTSKKRKKATIIESLAGIGPIVRDAIGDAVSVVPDFDSYDDEFDDDDMESIDIEKGSFSIEKGSTLIIENNRGRMSGGDIVITGTSEDQCSIEGNETAKIRIRQNSDNTIIRWKGKHLELKVPDILEELIVKSKGGDIEIGNLECDIRIKTLGGDLSISDISGCFNAKTMGGDVDIAFRDKWTGSSDVVTMGGDITINIPDGVEAHIRATTMGGSITANEIFNKIGKQKTVPGRIEEYYIGSEETESSIRLKTMGGDIELRKS